ncbi:helix-turn-helix domain-containing protein [Aminobacter sp. BE322]|uniref:helix-turn-helix domain-containing protein n=1 Tax=unclassified Aminobacter TaxID=2644704 RepID=UPI003D18FE2A
MATKSLYSERHRRLAALLVEKRKQAGLTQATVAAALGRHQPFIANIENGERRLDVVEFLALADIIGFDPHEIVNDLLQIDPHAAH